MSKCFDLLSRSWTFYLGAPPQYVLAEQGRRACSLTCFKGLAKDFVIRAKIFSTSFARQNSQGRGARRRPWRQHCASQSSSRTINHLNQLLAHGYVWIDLAKTKRSITENLVRGVLTSWTEGCCCLKSFHFVWQFQKLFPLQKHRVALI